jgi:hypothetical protein
MLACTDLLISSITVFANMLPNFIEIFSSSLLIYMEVQWRKRKQAIGETTFRHNEGWGSFWLLIYM